MKNVSKTGKIRGIFLVSLFTICTVAVIWRRFGTSNTSNPVSTAVKTGLLYQQKRVLQYNTKVYSQAVRLAEDGDIVFKLDTTGASADNSENSISYSQSGIISRERDTVFVYHTIPEVSGSLPTIIREPLWNFGHPVNSKMLALYRILPDSSSRNTLMVNIRQQYQQKQLPDSVRRLAADEKMPGNALIVFNMEKASQSNLRFNRSGNDGQPGFKQQDITGNPAVKAVKQWAY